MRNKQRQILREAPTVVHRSHTPVGLDNPDWAIVFEQTKRLYLVRGETKGCLDVHQRRHDENVKIECVQRHFKAIGRLTTQSSQAWSLRRSSRYQEAAQS